MQVSEKMKVPSPPPSPPQQPADAATEVLSKKAKKKALQKAMTSGQKVSKASLKELYGYQVILIELGSSFLDYSLPVSVMHDSIFSYQWFS